MIKQNILNPQEEQETKKQKSYNLKTIRYGTLPYNLPTAFTKMHLLHLLVYFVIPLRGIYVDPSMLGSTLLYASFAVFVLCRSFLCALFFSLFVICLYSGD